MIDIIKVIFKMLIILLPFLFACARNKKINLPKVERSKQFLMPIITVIFSFITMIIIHPINEKLLTLIKNLPLWISSLTNSTGISGNESVSFSPIGNMLKEFIEKINLNFWIFFLVNFLIIFVYLIIKKISLYAIRKFVETDSDFHTKVAGNFYEYFPQKGIWCLKANYVQARSLLKTFYYSAIILSVLLTLLSRSFYYKQFLSGIFYPVFGIIIVGELYFYLDGLAKKEYVNDILGEDEDAYKIVNYTLLRKFLRNLFGDKLLAENTSVNSFMSNDITSDDILRELDENEDRKTVTFATYLKALNSSGFPLDHNYIYSSLDLLNRKSILFNNPFYNDLIPYAFYPMNRVLLSHKKVLIVLGRHKIEDNIKSWVENGIGAVTNIPFLWNMGILDSETSKELDIGILTRSDVCNIKLHETNSEFFDNVEYMVIIEPSKLISTAQIGLNLIVKRCGGEKEGKITYCLCDENCDGLVDSMSHTLMTSLTEVCATNKHTGTSSYMCWEIGNDYLHHRIVPNISRYLGMGTELSFVALKNQVSKTQWFGGEAFPVTDLKWIAKQYYYELMKYSGLPANQEIMNEKFVTSPDFWSSQISEYNYITVEDESFNMFEVLRNFSTRSSLQGFINIISSDYLLKDYMADNASVFETDAKAIPCIVADYVRSDRNTVLRLILMMSMYPVSEETIKKEFSMLGIKIFNLKQQLWHEIFCCYADASTLKNLPEEYKEAVNAVSKMALFTKQASDYTVNIEILCEKDVFNIKSGKMEHSFYISDSDFIEKCVFELKSAGYIAEDEKGDKYYLGSELIGQIYQKYLPGQFFTFNGKYYEMRYLTGDGQVLVRRASDHITDRRVYRQIREYTFFGIKSSEKIGSSRNISGLKVVKEYSDITVNTLGYYSMKRYNCFQDAKEILFEGSKSGIPKRIYYNKEILRITLPSFDGKLTDKVRYTITLLFNEIFKTLFAENSAYIVAVTDGSENQKNNPLTYLLKSDGCEPANDSIYIIEDSQLDLGLTVAVERNLQRIFEIVDDYLKWHTDTLEDSLNPPPDPEPPVELISDEENNEPQKKEGTLSKILSKIKIIISKISNKIRSLFKRKTDKPIPEEDEKKPDEIKEPDDKKEEQKIKQQMNERTDTVNSPAPDEENYIFEGDKAEKTIEGFVREPYHNRYYLLYGNSEEPDEIDICGTFQYISRILHGENPLKQARDSKNLAEFTEATFKPGKTNARYCDFCGQEIFGVEYETLSDGRDRCINCGRTAIKTGEEFKKVFDDVKRNMESFFNIKLNVGIRVEMVNSKKLHKRLGKTFIPTSKFDGRVLGVAIKDKSGYTLMVENGSPRIPSMLTMAHELTHIWQYVNWNSKLILSKYSKELNLQIYEGMAKWVEVQYAYLINEPAVAKREELITAYRNDVYQKGFLRYLANYPFSKGTYITKDTPFMHIDTPLEKQYCKEISYNPHEPSPVDDSNKGSAKKGNKPSAQRQKHDNDIIERNPEKVKPYAFGLLNEDEKKVYIEILKAINSFSENVENIPCDIISDRVFSIINYILYDHPEISWLASKSATAFSDQTSGKVKKITLKYCLTKEETQKRTEKINSCLADFKKSISHTMSDYDVALKIYENIINLVDYDTVGLKTQQNSLENEKTNSPDDLRSIYGVFVNKKAVCAGYAKATQYLMNLFGIECAYITSAEHAWNLIKLEGDYYHLDTTWGDHSNTDTKKNISDTISYKCFCITTREVLKLDEHEFSKDLKLPECTATKCNYFVRKNLYFNAFDKNAVLLAIQNEVDKGNIEVSIKFSDKMLLKEAEKNLIIKNEIFNIKYKGEKITSCSHVSDEKLFIFTIILKK